MTAARSTTRPNVVVILVDDMGYSDLGCYGGEIRTPNLDRLADGGVRMSQFYNTARCSPARASLLTGLHPHQTGIGVLTGQDAPLGYPGRLNERCVTMAEVLRSAGYGTYHSGKWHLTPSVNAPDGAWPTERGFDHSFGLLSGAANYFEPATIFDDQEPITEFGPDFYLTDAIGDRAAAFIHDHQRDRADDPLFCYVAFNAPHWPLHAPEEAIEAYRGAYDQGWDETRRQRHQRQVEDGLISESWELADRDPTVPAWEDAAFQDWQARRMEVYAAQVSLMDAAVGRVLDALTETGRLEDTLIIFLSDNGGCAEEFAPTTGEEARIPPHHRRTHSGEPVQRANVSTVIPGDVTTFASYGVAWANVSNTPFREYKHWVHEGGIATPLIAHWPAGLPARVIDHTPGQLPDLLATVLAATGAEYPERHHDQQIPPLEGVSLLPSWSVDPTEPERDLFFEHEGNAAIRRGPWKLVRKYGQGWELFDLDADRTEQRDLAADHPELVISLIDAWQCWADRCGVIDRARVLAAMRRPVTAPVSPPFNSNPAR